MPLLKGWGVRAENVTTAVPDTTVLFLGSGTYGGEPGRGDDEMRQRLTAPSRDARSPCSALRQVFPGARKSIVAMTDMVMQKGATVLGSYHCKGRFLLVNWGRPDKEEPGERKAVRTAHVQ